jgi:hypothetical protein
MEKPAACLMCGAPLEQPTTGHPRVYCGTTCRRAAEYALRRVQSLLLVAEKTELAARAALELEDFADERRERRKVARWWAGEVARLQGRLRELLGAQDEPS